MYTKKKKKKQLLSKNEHNRWNLLVEMRGRLCSTITQNMTRYDQRRPGIGTDELLQNKKSNCSVTHLFLTTDKFT